jgi:hypothetical protein
VKFLAMVEGVNFQGKIEGKITRIGFYANREVEAENVETIDQEALFRSVLQELESNSLSTTPKSRMWVSRVSQRNESDGRQFGGFSFYPQTGWLQRAFSKLLQ